MFDQITTEELCHMDALEIIQQGFLEAPPQSLDGLTVPNPGIIRLDERLTTLERQVAGTAIELQNRLNLIKEGCISLPEAESESLIGTLEDNLETVVNLLGSTIQDRMLKETEYHQYNHFEAGDDGNIYGCLGQCPGCLSIKQTVMDVTAEATQELETNVDETSLEARAKKYGGPLH